jgi:DNA-binding NarL/FixJ family response regulator
MSNTYRGDESGGSTVSIGVVEDRVVVREGLRVILGRSAVTRLEWVTSTLSEALLEASARPIDALFVSVDLGGHSFQSATSRLRRAFRHARLIGVIVDANGWATRVGDRSMIDDQLLVGGVQTPWLKALSLKEERPHDSIASPTRNPHHALTNREREVLSLLVRARDNRSIALSLGIAEATVKRHVSSILAKFGSRSRAEACLVSRQLGYAVD